MKGGSEIVTQVKNYARALAADPRWAGTKTTWTFWAVTWGLDAFGEEEINQADRPRGRIDIGKNHSAWLRTWGSLLEDCRARMEYLRQALEVETKKEAGVRHLREHYADNMPQIVETVMAGRVKQVSVKRTRGGKKKVAKSRSKRPTASGNA